MSDEDRDIDIESDDDLDTNESYGHIRNGSFGSGSISGGLQSGSRSDMMSPVGGPLGEDKRAHHNALERKRRDHIKDSFSSLRECVPSLNGEKASRAQILKKATEYIQFMRKKNSNHQHDIEDLKRQNTQLEAQIRALEKAKATGQFASVTALLTQSNHSDNSSSDMDSDNSVFKRKRLRTALTE